MEDSPSVRENDVVVPGDLISSSSSFTSGPGCYARDGKIYSQLVGRVCMSKDTNEKEKRIISVLNSKSPQKNIPAIGFLVICKVTSISERQVKGQILSVNGSVPQEPFHGVLRREDIRAMEKDSVEVFQSFRPRDLMRARVIAYGEGQTYLVSTAENELGVVWAQCGCGRVMQPVSWCEMQCTKGDREKRKVAKVMDAIPIIF